MQPLGFLMEVYYFCAMNVELNIDRLRYLLSLYGMKEDDLLDVLNKDRKRKITAKQVFTGSIEFSLLKKIDELFGKGFPFYVDPTPIEASANMSVFFRKKTFSEQLNFTAKKVVNDFESLKNYLASLDSLSGVSTKVNIPHCTQRTHPRVAALRLRSLIYPNRQIKENDDKGFLKALISNLADVGVRDAVRGGRAAEVAETFAPLRDVDDAHCYLPHSECAPQAVCAAPPSPAPQAARRPDLRAARSAALP